MVTLEDTIRDRDWLSDKLSTQARWFAGAVVLLLWGLISAPAPPVRLSATALVFVGLLAITVLFIDFLQYAAGYIATERLAREILRLEDRRIDGYDRREPFYRARRWCFWGKQIAAAVTFVALLVVLVPALVR